MAKLDPVKVKWMVGEMKKGGRSAWIAARTGVPPRRARQIRARYRRTGEVPALGVRGRTRNEIQDRARIPAEEAFLQCRTGASRPGRIVAVTARIRIPHNTTRRVLKKGMAAEHPKKSRRRERIGREGTRSDSPRHAGYERLPDGRQFVAHRDDASRFIAGHGAFEEAAGKHAPEAPWWAMAERGRPAPIMADRVSRSCASGSKARKRGRTGFEGRLGVRHILAGVGHPQTNGRPEGLRGEIRGKIERFSGMGEFVRRHDRDRPRGSPDQGTPGTPAGAFARKMPEKGQRVKDEHAGEEHLAS